MADQPTTTQQPKTGIAAAIETAAQTIAALPGKTTTVKDPTDKTNSNLRYVQVNGQWVLANPLGVEPTYAAPFRGQRTSTVNDPGAQGNEYLSAIPARYDATSLDEFGQLAPERIADIQKALARSGLLAKETAYSVWTPETASAMQKVLVYANQRGLLWQDALDEWAAAGVAAGLDGGSSGPKFTPRLSNPDDLKATFRQVAYNRTGGNFMDEAAYDRMVAAYQDAEMKAQRAQFDAAVAGGGATVDAPSAQTFGEQQVQAENADLVAAHDISGYGKVFEGLMGSWQ